jgi:hypothetical protein
LRGSGIFFLTGMDSDLVICPTGSLVESHDARKPRY